MSTAGAEVPVGEEPKSRLGPLRIAIAIFVVISLILSALFCAFPWGMTVHAKRAGSRPNVSRRPS